MIEIALALVANALVAGAITFIARGSGPAKPIDAAWAPSAIAATTRAAGAAAILFVLGAALRTSAPFSRAAAAASGWVAGACLAGALATLAADRAQAWLSARSGDVEGFAAVRSAAGSLLTTSLVVTLILTMLASIASAAVGALGKPELAAPSVPLTAAGLGVGVCISAATLATSETADWLSETAVETVAAMIVAASMWEANAELFRRGPVVASALGLVLLPVVLRPLFALTAAAGSLFAKKGDDESVAHALSRSAHVSASLVLVVLIGTTLGALGKAWMPFFFCGAAGVAAVIALLHLGPRVQSPAATSLALLACASVATLVSVVVASRTGLAHAQAFGLVLCAAGAQGASLFPRATARLGDDVVDGEASALAVLGARALGALAIGAAVVDAVSDAACSKWSTATLAPTGDWASVVAHCESARASLSSVDAAKPVVLVAALIGIMVAVYGKLETARSTAAIAVVVCAAALAGRAFEEGAACLAAVAIAAVIASAAAPTRTQRTTALFVSAVSIVLAPIAV